MARRKPRSLTRMSHASVVTAEKNHYGPEPDFTDSVLMGCKRLKSIGEDGDPDTTMALLKALNWYNAIGNPANYKKWIVEYAKASLGLDSDELKYIRSINDTAIPNKHAITARLYSRGAEPILVGERVLSLDEFIHRVVVAKKAQAKRKAKSGKTKTSTGPSVQDYMNLAAGQLFADHVAPVIDELFTSKGKSAKKIAVYDALIKAETKGRVALKVAELVVPVRDELKETIAKTDPELVEGYSYLSAAQKNKVLAGLEAIIDDCNKINTVTKKTRKTKTKTGRKKATPSANKLLKGFNYKLKDDEYKAASSDPKKIVGASIVVLFHTQNRKATVLYAQDENAGLSIKGASVIGYDETKSVTKTIRKPIGFVSAMTKAGKRAIKKSFGEVNGKNIFKNGKVNKHVLILRVV